MGEHNRPSQVSVSDQTRVAESVTLESSRRGLLLAPVLPSGEVAPPPGGKEGFHVPSQNDRHHQSRSRTASKPHAAAGTRRLRSHGVEQRPLGPHLPRWFFPAGT